MKLALPTLVLSFALNAGASSIYISDFDTTLDPFVSDVNGQDGWSINDTTDQFSFVANWNNSNAIGLGDVSVVDFPPAGSEVMLSRIIGRDIGATLVTFDFALIDSLPDSFPNRDRFGISLLAGGDNLFSITFVPETPVNPDDPLENFDPVSGVALGAKWFVYYGLNDDPLEQLNMAIFDGATYGFRLLFTPNVDPSQTDFVLSLTGTNTLSDGATLAIDPSTSFDEFGIFWAQTTDDNDYGSSLILVDNLSIIPEPSKSLLLLLGVLGLMARRRRRA